MVHSERVPDDLQDKWSVSHGEHAVGAGPGAGAPVVVTEPTRLMGMGGEKLDAHRFIWWNVVSSRKQRVVQASRDWRLQAMAAVQGDAERIPLPERRFVVT